MDTWRLVLLLSREDLDSWGGRELPSIDWNYHVAHRHDFCCVRSTTGEKTAHVQLRLSCHDSATLELLSIFGDGTVLEVSGRTPPARP